MNDSLKIETRGERELVITRTFDASRERVFLREVVRPERVVRTEVFGLRLRGAGRRAARHDGAHRRNGRTRMHLTVQYPSREARDGALASGMEHGMSASYANLDEVLRVPA